MSVKVLGCFGSHCSTARLADTYKAVALTGFIAVRSAGSLKELRLRESQPFSARLQKISKSLGKI